VKKALLKSRKGSVMRRHLLLTCVALSLAAPAPRAAAAVSRYEIQFLNRDEAWLAVVAGKVRAVYPPDEDYDWELSPGVGGPQTIEVLEPRKWGGWHLAYDPEGKDPAVFLAEERGPGTQWKVTRLKGEKDLVFTIQAAEGKYKGWYLDVAAKGEKFVTPKGKTAPAYRVFLSKKPRRLPKLTITHIAP
jgi:hypothetical protein